MSGFLENVFANKLMDDNRVNNPLFTFGVPDVFGGKICSFLAPDFAFYYQLVVVVIIQSTFNAMLGYFVYKIMVEPSKEHGKSNSLMVTTHLFAFGAAIPLVVMEPIYLMQYLGVTSPAIGTVFLATPIVNSLRIAEALYGFVPIPMNQSLFNYVIYFSCFFGIVFDPVAGKPKRISRKFLSKQLKALGRDFALMTIIISILKRYNYEFFYTKHHAYSSEHSLQDILSWQHLLNNFLVAVLLSTCLSQSSIGVSTLYNLLYGYETFEMVQNPMFKSTSVSEFWGRRWNTLVHKGLKNGVYKPARKYSSSKLLGVIATFVVSGVIHEYINFVLFFNRGKNDPYVTWKQIMFFGWNGILLAMEYCVGHWAIFKWMSRNLPQLVITALILCCALPLAHLFTGDYIQHGWFDAVYLSEFVVECRDL
mmetsp:Transcript_22298/g.51072  ORF Transcript_22298/g.51072 Transcript_22298/m.51072 type:complete len:422 (-) Transcript_22298:190-1455(-)